MKRPCTPRVGPPQISPPSGLCKFVLAQSPMKTAFFCATATTKDCSQLKDSAVVAEPSCLGTKDVSQDLEAPPGKSQLHESLASRAQLSGPVAEDREKFSQPCDDRGLVSVYCLMEGVRHGRLIWQ